MVKNTKGGPCVVCGRSIFAFVFGFVVGLSMIPFYDLDVHVFDGGHLSSDDEVQALENTTLAKYLETEVRVLCWIMTGPMNHELKARHVNRTWGKRCNKLIFISSAANDELDTIVLPVKEGRDYLWSKTRGAFKYIHDNYIEEYDWFLKADDDTYVIVENLRFMLYAYSPNDPLYFGCKFKPFVQQGFMTGGAGYVLSREAVKRFIENGFAGEFKCRTAIWNGPEDVEMGKCLQNLNVFAGDSRDELGRGRFFNFMPEQHLFPNREDKNLWYWKYVFYNTSEGLDSCSYNAISFHYVLPHQMYVLDYLIYHLQPYGIIVYPQALPNKVTIDELLSNTTDRINSQVDRIATELQP